MRKATEQMVVTTVRVPRKTLDALQALAESEHRTVSQEVRWLIDQRLLDQRLLLDHPLLESSPGTERAA